MTQAVVVPVCYTTFEEIEDGIDLTEAELLFCPQEPDSVVRVTLFLMEPL